MYHVITFKRKIKDTNWERVDIRVRVNNILNVKVLNCEFYSKLDSKLLKMYLFVLNFAISITLFQM